MANGKEKIIFVLASALVLVTGGWEHTCGEPFAYPTSYEMRTISTIDLETGSLVGSPVDLGIYPRGVSVNSDGTRVYIVGDHEYWYEYGVLKIFDTASGRIIRSDGCGEFPQGVAVSPAGDRLYVTNYGQNSLIVYDGDGKSLDVIDAGVMGPFGVAVHPSGDRVYVTGRTTFEHTVSAIDAATYAVTAWRRLEYWADLGICSFWIKSEPYGIAVNPAGTRIYVTGYTEYWCLNWTKYGTVHVLDANTLQIIKRIEGLPYNEHCSSQLGEYCGPRGIAVSPTGKRVYVANVDSVSVIDAETNELLTNIAVDPGPEGQGLQGIVVSKDGTRVYATNTGNSRIEVIDAVTNELLTPIQVPHPPFSFGNFMSLGFGVSVTPLTHDFGEVAVGASTAPKEFTIKNELALEPYALGAVSVTGQDAIHFTIYEDNCSGRTLSPLESCTVKVAFTPHYYYSKEAALSIEGSGIRAKLKGVGGPLVPSNLRGFVFDEDGVAVPGASVWVGASFTTTDSMGFYRFDDISFGDNIPVLVGKSGYSSYSGTINIPPNTTLLRSFTLYHSSAGDIKITGIRGAYSGHVFYMERIPHSVEYTVNVDWGIHSPGSVRFITPGGIVDVPTTENSVSREFDMGDFPPCTKLSVIAIGGDGSLSELKEADFTIMRLIPYVPGLTPVDLGDRFSFESKVGLNLKIFEEGVGGTAIPLTIPLFGGHEFNLKFIPEVRSEVTSGGEATYELAWNNVVKGKAGGLEYELTPKLGISGTFSDSECRWQWGGLAGVSGKVELSKTWPTVVVIGPVPVPVFFKLSFELEADATLKIMDLAPIKMNGELDINPYLRGSVGVGVDDVLNGQVWVGAGADFVLQWPQDPTLKELTVYVNGGFTGVLFLFEYEQELFRAEWALYEGPSPTPFVFQTKGEPRPFRRGYLNVPGYGTFVNRPKHFRTSVSTRAPFGAPVSSPIQLAVFPYSSPSLSASNGNLYLTWLYDDPVRTSLNRTQLVFTSWDGSAWSAPQPVADNGTADFRPQIATFSDGSALVVWEDERIVFEDTATIEEMARNLEISTSIFNPLTKAWEGFQRLTSNDHLDRNPKISGISKNDVLLTWVSNEANDLLGSASNPNKLWYSRFDGSAWSPPQAIAEVPYPILKTSFAYDGTIGHLILSVDTDGDASTLEDHELYKITYSEGVWSALTRLTNDTVTDTNPEVVLASNGDFVLVWLKGDELSSVTNFDMGSRTVIKRADSQGLPVNFKMAPSSDGTLALLWADPVGYGSDLSVMFYDPTYQVWGGAKRLTNDPQRERDFVFSFYAPDAIITVYDRDTIEQKETTRVTPGGREIRFEIPEIVGTDLYMMQYTLQSDLALEQGSLAVDPPNPKPETKAVLSVNGWNPGDRAVKDVPIAFYLGDPASGGTKIGETLISEVLKPGEVKKVSVDWIVPRTTSPLQVFAVIDPEGIFDPVNRTNNKVAMGIVKPDLTIRTTWWERITPNLLSITARIANEGGIAAGGMTLKFKRDSAAGPVLHTENLGSVGPYESIDVNFLWDVSGLPAPKYTVFIVVDEENGVDEFSEENNEDTIVIEGHLQDISVTPLSQGFGSEIAGRRSSPKSITVSNTGTADLEIGTINLTGPDSSEFDTQNDNCSGRAVKPGSDCVLEVVFMPTGAGAKEATLSIPSNDPDTPVVEVALAGTGIIAPILSVRPPSVDFGAVEVNHSSSPQTITISNLGKADLVITSVGILGGDSAMFGVADVTCGGLTFMLAPESSCTITVTFTPTSEGTKTSFVRISSNDPEASTLDVALVGSGMDVVPPAGSITIDSGAAYTKSASVTLSLTCDDGPGSGCAQMRLSNDGITWLPPEAYRDLRPWTLNMGCWSRRVPLIIHNFQPNYQTRLIVPYDSEMRPDFADLRFRDETAGMELPYWFDKKENGVYASVWFKTGPNNNVFMYYGNAEATTGESAKETFEFFDDFLGTALDSDEWVQQTAGGGHLTVGSGVLTLDSSPSQGYAEIEKILSLPYQVEARIQVSNVYSHNRVRGLGSGAPFDVGIGFDDGGPMRVFFGGYSFVSTPVNEYIRIRAAHSGSVNTWGLYWEDGSTVYANSYSGTPSRIGFSVGDDNGSYYGKVAIDWLFVRKYAEVEPEVSLGVKEPLSACSGDGLKTVYAMFGDLAGNWSGIYSDTIILDTVIPTTTATPPGGWYTSTQIVTLSADEPATIYYTRDGTTPTMGSDVYSSPLIISTPTTLKFFAVDLAGNMEGVKTEVYTIAHTLSVSKKGTGTGKVTSDPPGVDCGGDCIEAYEAGKVVQLTALADAGSFFSGWEGCDNPSGALCHLTMDEDKNVTATFTRLVPKMSVSRVLLQEDFSLGIPETWLVGGGWVKGPSGVPCGNQVIGNPFVEPWAIVDSSDASCLETKDERLYTPVFDASRCSRLTLLMSSQFDYEAGSSGRVMVRGDGGEAWLEVDSIGEDQGPDWKELEISSVAGREEAEIGFLYSAIDGYWALDHVWVMCEPAESEMRSPVSMSSSPHVFVIQNRGTAALEMGNLSIADGDVSQFRIPSGGDGCSGRVLAPMEWCVVEVVFEPTTEGDKEANLSIPSNDPGSPILVKLIGRVVRFFAEPKEGTFGTEVRLRGMGFGGKRGKVLIGGVSVKVIEWNEDVIHGLLSKVPSPGDHDIEVQRKEPKGAVPLIEEGTFKIKGPEIYRVFPASGSDGDSVVVRGKYFGTKKGKVYLGEKACKVLRWAMDSWTGIGEVEFLVPKGLAKGTYDLTISNKVGMGKDTFTIR